MYIKIFDLSIWWCEEFNQVFYLFNYVIIKMVFFHKYNDLKFVEKYNC
jgi:hypothetical protein